MKTISISRWVAVDRGCVRSISRSGPEIAMCCGWSSGHSRAPLLALFMLWFVSSLPVLAQVNRNLGTIPPGGSVTITFDVTINGNFPTNTASVTNQGIVTGTGFLVLTDDPLTPSPNDPTVTAVTVAPQITCPPNITTNGFTVCSQPAVAFAATVTAGVPAPTVTYKLGATTIASPYVFPPGTNVVTVTATNGTTPNALCSFNVVVLPIVPQLTVFRANTNVVVSWTNLFPCYKLEFTPAFLAPLATNVWTLHPGPFTTNAGRIYVTNGITPTNRFFRLAY